MDSSNQQSNAKVELLDSAEENIGAGSDAL